MKFIKRLIFAVLLIIIIAISLIVYMGHAMYKEAINKVSIQDKIQEIKKDEK